MTERIQQLHAWFCEATGQKLRLDQYRERAWWEILHAGFTEQDVRRVVWYLRKEIAYNKRNAGALKLSNMLQIETFEEDLNLSRAKLDPDSKLPPLPGRASATSRVCGGGGVQAVEVPAGAGQVVTEDPEAGARAAEEFKRLKETL